MDGKSHLKQDTVKKRSAKQKFSYVAEICNKPALTRYCEIPRMLVICTSNLSRFYHSKYL